MFYRILSQKYIEIHIISICINTHQAYFEKFPDTKNALNSIAFNQVKRFDLLKQNYRNIILVSFLSI